MLCVGRITWDLCIVQHRRFHGRQVEILCSLTPCGQERYECSSGGISFNFSICGMALRTACGGVTGVCNDPIWPLSYSPGCRGPPQTSVCRAAKPRFLLNRYIKVAAWGLGWWDQSNQDAAEKAVPALVVIRTNPFASLWKRNLPLSFCSV